MHRLAAALIGAAIAIGAAGLLLDPQSEENAAARDRPGAPSPHTLKQAGLSGPNEKPVNPGSHQNATTDSDAKVRLNPHFLVGKATTICTKEPTLAEPLEDAIEAWDNAIGNVGFDVIASPATCANPDVRVDLLNYPRCTDSVLIDGVPGTRTNPCYVKDPPKAGEYTQVFKVRGVAPALIAYPTNTPIRVSTLIHEIGHALGLPDYNDSADPTACQAIRSIDADPQQDDVVVMAPRGNSCRSPELITARDMRDFHEAYRVEAITQIGVAARAIQQKGKNGTQLSGTQITVSWRASHAEEALHNATYVALFSRNSATAAWTHRASMPLRKENGKPRTLLRYKTFATADEEHKVVGLTRAGIDATDDAADPPGLVRTSYRGKDDTQRHSYFEGDPTLIDGVSATEGALIVSASLSPVYCYPTTNSVLAASSALRKTEVSWRVSGGGRSRTVAIGSSTSNARRGSLTHLCSGVPSASEIADGRTVRVAVASGSGSSAQSESVSLYLTVLPVLSKVELTDLTASPSECAQGSVVKATLTFANAIPVSMRAWVNGNEISLGTGKTAATSVVCKADAGGNTGNISAFALDKGGGGGEASTEITVVPRLTFQATSSWRHCVSGTTSVPISWTIAGGKAPYSIAAPGATPRTSDMSGTLTATCPIAPRSSISLTATDHLTPSQSATDTITITPVQPLSLALSGGAPSCDTGGTTKLSWTLSGGTQPYSLTVAGSTSISGNTATVTCQSTAGTQSFTVRVSDSSQPTLRASLPIDVTVTRPAPRTPTLALTAWTTSQHCVTATGTFPVSWSVSGGTKPYTVSAPGSSSGSTTGTSGTLSATCPGTSSRSVTVTATDSGSPSQSDTASVSIKPVAALSLSRSGSTPTCETGASVTLSWTVSGGTAPYEVRIAGQRVSNGVTTKAVTCGTTAGTQSFSYQVTDSSTPELSASGTLSVTVTKSTSTSTSTSVTGKLTARKRTDGRVEFCFVLSGQTTRVCPASRYVTPSRLTADRWVSSSVVTATVSGQSSTLGKISVALKGSGSSAYIDVCFTPQGGSRTCPGNNNFPHLTATTNRWLSTRSFTFTITSGGLSGASGDDEELMESGPAPDNSGTDGGLMDADLDSSTAPDSS